MNRKKAKNMIYSVLQRKSEAIKRRQRRIIDMALRIKLADHPERSEYYREKYCESILHQEKRIQELKRDCARLRILLFRIGAEHAA